MFSWLKGTYANDSENSKPSVREVESQPELLPAENEKKTNANSRGMNLIEVQPVHVVLCGSAVVAAGATLTGVLTYRSGAKSLADEGINPDTRWKIVPVAVKTMLLSTVLTAVIGLGGFMALRACGVLTTDRAEIPSVSETVKFVQHPRAYLAELFRGEQQQQHNLVMGDKKTERS
ncbi:hypothetical protein CEUSTIGMA_g6300.t1 [Chlamydomonas eustigma]|uniref:Uncharacterized protein n=1 Tax=Chlamydomonas eustigma TaxID=1157962 RepID=A0A250X7J8_9CHLO|nr:hypothetical protein CEUSTIGMA_g6300.t1 [Chlamydomonas eustigma]|eukprot:GAX78862.1 hypothetical protein CEUSTIGMA_g6300.t1 [Chlamydomonas eustigma]